MLLIDLVEKYYSIIECKKTDGISNKIKQLEWIKIGKEFNSFNTHMERDFNSLKTLWENLKKKAKAVITAMNTNKYATGGGPYRTVKEDQIIERVIPIIKKELRVLITFTTQMLLQQVLNQLQVQVRETAVVPVSQN
ncbi:myb/SANT-like DNA-binding domain-containing protein 3 [Nilaparvata lugens]|uniref:myb/SANT-like DNA-binding domain-containing protein 3 n=1 Tax=Nilaparvata lugens TaxID=108931 RepID=UPI00193E281D|nr:myb/SANT-like DNA-binding domain-containing protein 3 [Nilaparvata lugens]